MRGQRSKAPGSAGGSLLEWARKQLIISNAEYEGAKDAYDAVIEYLQGLSKSIHDMNAINGFWNIEYDARKIKSKRPKRETDIHPTIRLLLHNLEILKGIQVIPEYRTGAGSLDFLFSARGKSNAQIFHVCLEVKLAHSSDLANGLLKQLPQYMETISTDYGIYLVLDFGVEHSFDNTKFAYLKLDNSEDNSEMDLEFTLGVAALECRGWVRPIILNLSEQTSPSKLKTS